MKKLHFTILVGILAAIAITNNVEAQARELAARSGVSGKEFSRISIPPVSENGHYLSNEKMNVRALKDFKKQYKTSDEKWAKSNDGIVALFQSDHIRYAVHYNKKGHWVSTIKSYSENQLEKNLRRRVKSEYLDYDITGVQEIEYLGPSLNHVYLVIMQHENLIKRVRIENGMMSVYKEL